MLVFFFTSFMVIDIVSYVWRLLLKFDEVRKNCSDFFPCWKFDCFIVYYTKWFWVFSSLINIAIISILYCIMYFNIKFQNYYQYVIFYFWTSHTCHIIHQQNIIWNWDDFCTGIIFFILNQNIAYIGFLTYHIHFHKTNNAFIQIIQ